MTNLIEERDKRTRNRKKKKKEMDRVIGLGVNAEKNNTLKMSVNLTTLGGSRIRLLDEGYCDQGFVIKKGTFKKFLNGQNEHIRAWEMDEDGEWTQSEVLNLTDDFVGHVNLGHMDFATFPFVVGEWDRNDLMLTEIGENRFGLDIVPRLDMESVFVKEIARQPYKIGVSAEFYYHINDEDTEFLSEQEGEYLPVIDEIFIFAYGLVGECGNVNSSGLELKGATMSKPKKELMAELVDIELDVEDTEEVIEELEELEEKLDEEIEEIENDTEEEATEEEAAVEELSADEEVSEEPCEEEEEAEEEESTESDSSEEDESEEVSDSADDEAEVEEAELSYEEILGQIKTLTAEVERLKDIESKCEALKKDNRRLNKKLADEKEAKAEFLAKTKELSVELFENEGEAERQAEEEAIRLAKEREYYKGDGIADK